MRSLKLVPVLCFALAACEIPTIETQTAIAPNQPVTPVTWKTDTPRVQRAADINECELAGRGLTPDATEEEIAAASASVDPGQVEAFVKRCLTQKGYTVTDRPVCTTPQIQSGTFVSGADFLPPLSDVKCFVVGQGFVV